MKTLQDDVRLFKVNRLYLRVAPETKNVRGHKVLAMSGRQIGEVTHLLISDGELSLFFLRIACDSAMGQEARHIILPLNRVEGIGDGTIQLAEGARGMWR